MNISIESTYDLTDMLRQVRDLTPHGLMVRLLPLPRSSIENFMDIIQELKHWKISPPPQLNIIHHGSPFSLQREIQRFYESDLISDREYEGLVSYLKMHPPWTPDVIIYVCARPGEASPDLINDYDWWLSPDQTSIPVYRVLPRDYHDLLEIIQTIHGHNLDHKNHQQQQIHSHNDGAQSPK